MPTIPRIVRFSSQKPIEHELPENSNDVISNPVINTILSIPLPKRLSDSDYNIEIHTASSTEKEATEMLLKNKANPNATNGTKWTPLMYAAYLGHTSICELLIKKGAGLNNQNQKGQTALMLAATCGHDQTVKLLIKENAEVNKQDCNGQSALHYAVSSSQSSTIEYLLSWGGNPNMVDLYGMTPTLEACSIGHEKILSILMKNKGNPLIVNKKGENGITLIGDSPSLLSILKQHGITVNDKKKGVTNIIVNQKNIENETTKQSQKLTITISEMLKAIKLEKYLPNFERNKIDMTNFFKLTDDEIDEMGIKAFGPKKKLLNIIQKYQQTGIFDIIQDTTDNVGNQILTNEELVSLNAQMTSKLHECQRKLQMNEEEIKEQKKIIQDQQMIITRLSASNEKFIEKLKTLNYDVSLNFLGLTDINQKTKLQERILDCLKGYYVDNSQI
ncbi:Sterile alpha motif domain and Ankyrin repeat and Sterile alpha motif/pointed domain and Ankyrin repeat-containing domain and Sterile alpha motif, type 1 domain-containing protein [Strongyloides ratti]|uniref:NAD(+) ADP-ribosyltransferase n=1 Tax=Strongyloides ratti TaxID=34506 RepID=A0A090LVC8_STRRB|nr:Sterile alpha motif domain and Ankyrin repeat and Sterile alpha motif/pointed domain and Ankyrin repeat-containing domain and Sterile alpha motif, type 1 domain-containing protein [Strongyloides ratti]CEF71619.1 Sterile alpha motif domain and Ankyrin repeat and Sterile alpha motif/pointed domain and Ankyrin repeat-containing domain and Sterile alpha motif, type 1 domain-containing protein [Strongyloides ratti]